MRQDFVEQPQLHRVCKILKLHVVWWFPNCLNVIVQIKSRTHLLSEYPKLVMWKYLLLHQLYYGEICILSNIECLHFTKFEMNNTVMFNNNHFGVVGKEVVIWLFKLFRIFISFFFTIFFYSSNTNSERFYNIHKLLNLNRNNYTKIVSVKKKFSWISQQMRIVAPTFCFRWCPKRGW